MIAGNRPTFLLDTNVLVDHYIGRGPRHDEVGRFIVAATARDIPLYIASLSLKDLFFIVEQDMKQTLRAAKGSLDPDGAAAARETAWSCVLNALGFALVVPVGYNEVLQAVTNRPQHDDFEDDLVVAAAQRANIDYLVTSDRALARHAPTACLDPKEALELLAG